MSGSARGGNAVPVKREAMPVRPSWANQDGQSVRTQDSGNVNGGNVNVDAGSGTITNTNGSGTLFVQLGIQSFPLTCYQVLVDLAVIHLLVMPLQATAEAQVVVAMHRAAMQEMLLVETLVSLVLASVTPAARFAEAMEVRAQVEMPVVGMRDVDNHCPPA